VAFAFAASTVIQNIFGACVVVIEELFHLGDWIMIDNIEGLVERIGEHVTVYCILSGDLPCDLSYNGILTSLGFRTTKIRQWDNHITYVPNAMFVTNPMHNYQLSKPMRIKFPVHLALDTPIQNLQNYLTAARKYIAEETELSKGRCVVSTLTQTSIQLDVTVFTEKFNPKDDFDQDWKWHMPYMYPDI
jgi:MscS family membrane protein